MSESDPENTRTSPPPAKKISRRRFLGWSGAAVAATLAGSVVDAWAIEPRWLRLHNQTVTLPHLSAEWDGLRVAHLTDLHLGKFTKIDLLREAVDLANSAQADLVLLTGDYVNRYENVTVELTNLLKALRAPLGVFACMGNHDFWAHIEAVAAALRAAGVPALINSHVLVSRGSARLCVAGVDDYMTGQPDIAAALAGVAPDICRLVLCHNPDYADEVPADQRVDMMFCGHTHGGQVNLPLVGPVHMPINSRKYLAGLADGPGFPVFTSVGIGTVYMPIRFCCRPEVAILTLRRG